MEEFLPKGYAIPDKGGSYCKFTKGDNRFRVLGSPIIGWEGWKTDPNGGKHPIRKHMTESFLPTEIDEPDDCKHFWAMPVYNYAAEAIQILEITQKGIQKSMKQLAADADWGNPRDYDIVVVRSGDGMETSYEVMPKPKKTLDAGIKKAYEEMQINLEALFEGKDPFAAASEAQAAQIADEVDAGLNEQNGKKQPF